MSMLKILAIAAAVAIGSLSFALGQTGYTEQGNTAGNAAASGGGGTHQNSLRTGSGRSTQKIHRNQNGYR